MSRKLSLIAAVARNGAIGKDNALLWRLPEDLKFFKRTTLGCPVIMGRKTWDSIGRPLPGRRNIVITRQPDWDQPGAERAASWADAIAMAGPVERIGVIGGAEIYALALPQTDELELTEIDADFDGDAFFPAWSRDDFECMATESHATAEGLAYRYASYRRRASPA